MKPSINGNDSNGLRCHREEKIAFGKITRML